MSAPTPGQSIKYLLIGDAGTGKQITEYSTSGCTSAAKKTGIQIFQKVSKSSAKKFDERNKILAKNEIYYFILTQPNLIFLILVEEKYPERLVFQLIDKIKEENIPLMVNEETKELNPQGRQALKVLVDKYQDQKNFNKIAEIQSDVDNLKKDMQDTIKKQVSNMEDVNQLEKKSEQLKMNTKDYANNASELKRVTWCQNCKLIIIISIIVIAVALAIILPIVL